MKKAVLFLLMCLCTTILSAQTSFYVSDVNQSYSDNAIVRSWDNGEASITYYEIGMDRYVQYVNYITGDSYRAEVPDYLKILDMYILNDTVFYCGYSVLDIGGRGVVGYFDPADFYSGIGHVLFRVLPVPPLTHVRKLVVQENGTGAIELIAIGEHQWNDTVFDGQGNFVQLVPHLNRHFLFCENMRQLYITYDTVLINHEEHYYDVLLTENYVVFVGVANYFPYNMICMRAIDRANAIPPLSPYTSPLDDFYYFPTGIDEVFSAMHSTATNKDSIATAYMYINTDGDVSNRVRVFDVAQMLNVYSQEYVVPDKSEARDLVYIPADNSLVCMQDFKTPSGLYNSNFVYLDPIATSNYFANIEYIKSTFFGSLTRRKDKFYLGSLGPTWFMKDKINLGTYPNPYCPQKEKIECNVLDNMDLNIYPIQLYPESNTHRKNLVIELLESRTIGIICNNP